MPTVCGPAAGCPDRGSKMPLAGCASTATTPATTFTTSSRPPAGWSIPTTSARSDGAGGFAASRRTATFPIPSPSRRAAWRLGRDVRLQRDRAVHQSLATRPMDEKNVCRTGRSRDAQARESSSWAPTPTAPPRAGGNCIVMDARATAGACMATDASRSACRKRRAGRTARPRSIRDRLPAQSPRQAPLGDDTHVASQQLPVPATPRRRCPTSNGSWVLTSPRATGPRSQGGGMHRSAPGRREGSV
jgi:hypothetical protein